MRAPTAPRAPSPFACRRSGGFAGVEGVKQGFWGVLPARWVRIWVGGSAGGSVAAGGAELSVEFL